MIKDPSRMEVEIKERMRDGEGSVAITHILGQDELTGKCRLFAKLTMEPGCSIGTHAHVDEEEIYYILKGKATVDDMGTLRGVGPGDAVLTGGGATHSIANTGDETLEFMAVILLY